MVLIWWQLDSEWSVRHHSLALKLMLFEFGENLFGEYLFARTNFRKNLIKWNLGPPVENCYTKIIVLIPKMNLFFRGITVDELELFGENYLKNAWRSDLGSFVVIPLKNKIILGNITIICIQKISTGPFRFRFIKVFHENLFARTKFRWILVKLCP